MAKAKKEQPGFEQLLQNLEQTVDSLEQGQLPLEELLQKYAEGIELVKACQIILNQAEAVLPDIQRDESLREESLWN